MVKMFKNLRFLPAGNPHGDSTQCCSPKNSVLIPIHYTQYLPTEILVSFPAIFWVNVKFKQNTVACGWTVGLPSSTYQPKWPSPNLCDVITHEWVEWYRFCIRILRNITACMLPF